LRRAYARLRPPFRAPPPWQRIIGVDVNFGRFQDLVRLPAKQFAAFDPRTRVNSAPLVPDASAENEARIIRVATFFKGEGGGLPERPGICKPDIRREFAYDLVTDTQAGIDLREP
jgi:hypothetical protein